VIEEILKGKYTLLILKILSASPEVEFYQAEIASKANLSSQTVARILKELNKFNLILKTNNVAGSSFTELIKNIFWFSH